MKILDLPLFFDYISSVEGVFSTLLNANWAGAIKRYGATGIFIELAASLTFRNAPSIRVSRQSTWRGIDIERLLSRYGIKVWDRGVTPTELYFCVKRRQVKWAEYVLLRAGVPVTSAPAEPRNSQWAAPYSGPPPQNRQRLASQHTQKRSFFDLF
jgi:hypothetical protein